MRHAAAIAFLATLSLGACGDPAPEPAYPPVAPEPAPTPAPVAVPYTGDFNLVGTEPFWGVKIRSDSLVFSRIDQAEIPVSAVTPHTSGGATIWVTEKFTVTIRPAVCSDGMSDRRYPFEAEVKVGAETLKGCAYRP